VAENADLMEVAEVLEIGKRESKGLTMPNKYDILNPSVRSTDFLCLKCPTVCVEELTVLPTDRRTGAFLLEEV
jgi:hypothetical protein